MQRVTCGRQMWHWRTSKAQAQDESVESHHCLELNWHFAFREDVAGIGTAKAEALEIVECLMAPARPRKGERALWAGIGVVQARSFRFDSDSGLSVDDNGIWGRRAVFVTRRNPKPHG